MRSSQHRINPAEINSLPPGTHGDGNNLYLIVQPSGSKSFMLRFQWQKRPDKMGLGAYDPKTFSLKHARDKAIDANRLLAQGINPKQAREEKRLAENAVLFFDFAEKLRLEKEQGFKHRAHKAKWKRTVHVIAQPLHKKPIDQITTADIKDALAPIWLKTPSAAGDARQHLEAIFDAAKALHLRKEGSDNPAAWKGNLKHLLKKLPKKGTIRGSHKSLPYEDMPTFMQELAAIDSIGARMLETCILTVARTKRSSTCAGPRSTWSGRPGRCRPN